MHVLVVGANGTVGRLVCDVLASRGHEVREHVRQTDRPLAEAARDVEAIVNCAGASVALGLGHGWRGYRAVDVPIGLACVAAARQTGARLVYVGVNYPPALRHTAYVDAHERVAAAMREVDGVIVRATGLYSAFAALLPLARRGILVDVGNGRARTNPIDERDLAHVVAGAIGGGPRELAVGGPQVLTRREIFACVAAATGRRVRIVRVPRWVAWAGGPVLRACHPRIGQFAQFATGLAIHDGLAPPVGHTTLQAYLAAAQLAFDGRIALSAGDSDRGRRSSTT
jgi:uncharacterized protein YbjT (DUF2867 family)